MCSVVLLSGKAPLIRGPFLANGQLAAFRLGPGRTLASLQVNPDASPALRAQVTLPSLCVQDARPGRRGGRQPAARVGETHARRPRSAARRRMLRGYREGSGRIQLDRGDGKGRPGERAAEAGAGWLSSPRVSGPGRGQAAGGRNEPETTFRRSALSARA